MISQRHSGWAELHLVKTHLAKVEDQQLTGERFADAGNDLDGLHRSHAAHRSRHSAEDRKLPFPPFGLLGVELVQVAGFARKECRQLRLELIHRALHQWLALALRLAVQQEAFLEKRRAVHHQVDAPDQRRGIAPVDVFSHSLNLKAGIELSEPPRRQLDPRLAEWTTGSTVLSIMAGITLEVMAQSFPKARHLVRSMPNMPGQIGAGVTAYAFGGSADEKAKADVEGILGSLGRVFAVEEPQIDAVTAMSGSGPGYVFEFACALEEAGIGIGLEKEFARTLAIETILGSGRLMARSDEHPETLRNFVTSPNGTTQAALERLTEGDFRKLIADAVSAARDRSLELSRPDA